MACLVDILSRDVCKITQQEHAPSPCANFKNRICMCCVGLSGCGVSERVWGVVCRVCSVRESESVGAVVLALAWLPRHNAGCHSAVRKRECVCMCLCVC